RSVGDVGFAAPVPPPARWAGRGRWLSGWPAAAGGGGPRPGPPRRQAFVDLGADEAESAEALSHELHVLVDVVVHVELLALGRRVEHGDANHGGPPCEGDGGDPTGARGGGAASPRRPRRAPPPPPA